MEQMLLALLCESEICPGDTCFRLPSTEPEISVGRGIAWIDPPPLGFGTSHTLRDPGAERTRVATNIEDF